MINVSHVELYIHGLVEYLSVDLLFHTYNMCPVSPVVKFVSFSLIHTSIVGIPYGTCLPRLSIRLDHVVKLVSSGQR